MHVTAPWSYRTPTWKFLTLLVLLGSRAALMPPLMPSDGMDPPYAVSEFFLLTLFLFAGTYLSALIPLYLPLPRIYSQYLNIYGTGLLLGAAFGVILPEGIEVACVVDKNVLGDS